MEKSVMNSARQMGGKVGRLIVTLYDKDKLPFALSWWRALRNNDKENTEVNCKHYQILNISLFKKKINEVMLPVRTTELIINP